ncbi:MAG: DNA primase [Candidatus Omnitrophota bacterium]
MGKIPQEVIDRVLDRVDIVDIISEYIQLKKAGRSFKANCPFHDEKTPSFVVSPDKQIFHCFGCGAGGNAIGFVMKYENMVFPEAVRIIADKVGIELPRYEEENKKKGASSIVPKLYEINRIAAEFFHNQLKSEKGKKALEYLRKRDIDTSTMVKFSIGYAPDEWEALISYCTAKKIPRVLLKQAGLIIESEKGRGEYDRFRNRIMFPVFNERGKILAFGGRVMDDSLPKYINSPETIIYSKSNVLYGLNFARQGIREQGYAVIVEGYLDVVIPFKYGLTNMAAASGTAVTQAQAKMLRRYSDSVVIVFDSDKAGESASLRGLDIFLENGMKVKLAALPQGEDPDSFVRKNGKEPFAEKISNAADLFEFKLTFLLKNFGRQDIGKIAGEMLPTISKIDNAVIQSFYIKRLAEELSVHESSLWHELKKVKPDYSRTFKINSKQESGNSKLYQKSELLLLGFMIAEKRIFDKVQTELGLDAFSEGNIKKAAFLVKAIYDNGETEIKPGKLLARIDEQDEYIKDVIVRAVSKTETMEDPHRAAEDCVVFIKKTNKNDELKKLTDELKKAQVIKDNKEIKILLNRINEIHKKKVI